MNHPKGQHYVPRFLLAKFGADGTDVQLFAYDKQRRKTFKAGVHKVAKEKGFYDVSVGDLTLTFEPGLSELETAASRVINRVLEREEVGFLDEDERNTIAQFLLVQKFRTRHFIEYVDAGRRALASALDEDAPGTSASLGFRDDPAESRALALWMLQRSGDFIPHILDKAWCLYEAPPQAPFWIGDNPVAMFNNVNQSEVRGTIGLAVPGIEIYFPISPRYSMAFLCKTLKTMAVEAHRRSLEAREAYGIELSTHEAVGAMRDGLEYGFPIPSSPENVEYANSLQVVHAERFVFASSDNFSMIQEMIDENPDTKRGPRPEVR